MSRVPVALLCVVALAVGATALAPAASTPGRQSKLAAVAALTKGTAKGYAHVEVGGGFDRGRSWRVRPANLTSKQPGFWCFKNLPFKPKSAAVTVDYRGTRNGEIPVGLVQMPRDDLCPKSTDAEVFTGLVDPGTFTEGKKLGFFVVFY